MRRTIPLATRDGRLKTLAGLTILTILATGLFFGAANRSAAEIKGPQQSDRSVALVVSQLLQREHVGRKTQALDDIVSRRGLNNFLKSLDPWKLYFYQADVDGFLKHRDELDDAVKRGDVGFGYTVFEVFLKRVNERAGEVEKLINLPHDFSAEETMVSDLDSAKYPKDAAEARESWRKRMKYELLKMKAIEKEKYDDKKAKQRLARRYDSVVKRWQQSNNDDLLELYLTAITTAFDPHTNYMSGTTLDNFNIDMSKHLEGIGAALSLEDGYTELSKIIPGGAADKDGRLKTKDRVVGVGQGENGEIVDVVDMRLSDVVKLIRGKEGTVVRLEVIPNGQTEKKIYKITRAKIELADSVARSVIFEDGKKAGGEKYKVGVIDLPSFYLDMEAARRRIPDYRSSTRDVRKILKSFKEEKVDAVVVDLRRDGGGSLTEAINLTGLFIDQGPVVQVKDANGEVDHYDDPEAGVEWEGPLVVLTSKFSASASEIFAGALQDYSRALIVGDKTTHGKGTVQSLLDLGERLFRIPKAPNLGALKITIQQFYRPNGDSTQKRGVLADVELPSVTTHWDVGEADLDYALEFDKIDPLTFEKVGLVNDKIIGGLREQSKTRCDASDDFQKVQRRIKRYKEQKERKTISLNEKQFLTEWNEGSAEKDGEDEAKEQEDPNRPVIKRDYYFNEALAVTLDYLHLWEKHRLAIK